MRIRIVYLDSNVGTVTLKPICNLVKRVVVTTPINDASSWTFCLCALPGSTSAHAGCVKNSWK